PWRARWASNTQVPGMSSYSSIFFVMGRDQTRSVPPVSTLTLDSASRLHALVKQRVGHALGEAPFGEHFGRLLELAGYPIFVDDVRVEVVFGRTAARRMKVPEVT